MREKTVKVGEKEVRFTSSAMIPLLYRNEFKGKDIFVDMQKLHNEMESKEEKELDLSVEALEVFERVAYIFAKHTAKVEKREDFESMEDWFLQFETFDIYLILPQIIDLWVVENQTKSKSKKKVKESTGK